MNSTGWATPYPAICSSCHVPRPDRRCHVAPLDSERYDAIIAGIYMAASDEEAWGVALDRISAGLDAWAVQLFGVDKRTGALLFSHDGGSASPQAALDYFRSYHPINPRVPPTLTLGPDDWFHDHEHFDDGFVAKSRFYQEFLIPHGGRFVSGTKVLEDAHRLVIFAALRAVGQPPFGPDERESLVRIKRHVTRAIALQARARDLQARTQVGATLLDQFARPMILVDAERRITYANAAGNRALDAGDYVTRRGNVLHCRDKISDQALANALYELRLVDGLRHADAPANRRFFRTNAGSDGRPIGVYLSALRPEQTMASFGTAPQALVFFHDARSEPGFDAMVVAETFDLTPAEAAVAVQLAAGETVERIAAKRSVAVATVRAQVVSIFAKTNTKRQADLVRVIVAMPGVDFR